MEQQAAPARKKRSPVIYIALAAVLLAGFYGVRAFLHGLKYESTDNAQVESRAVPVISRVSGYLDSIAVDDYGKVSSGQLLVQIDPTEFELALRQAEGDLLNAKADVANAEAALRNAQANRRVAEANSAVQQVRLNKAEADLKRDEQLYQEQAVTSKQIEDTRSTAETTRKQLAANREQVSLAGTQVATAEAQLQKARAQMEVRTAAVEQARLRLQYCTITAPVSGKIGRRNLEKGQFIQPGAPLFSIVNDEVYWIVANFKETQLEKMKEGQRVRVILDGYPDVEIEGTVGSFSQATGSKFALLPPDNATGNFVKVTQRVPVKINLSKEAQYKNILRAGLSAEVEVEVN